MANELNHVSLCERGDSDPHGPFGSPDPKSRTTLESLSYKEADATQTVTRTGSHPPAPVSTRRVRPGVTSRKNFSSKRSKKPELPKRSDRVKSDFKAKKNARGRACCEVCGWRPPAILREVAGGMVESLLHAHHVVPVACGGADHADNLILVCPTHHAMAHHMGRMSHGKAGTIREWRGPLNAHDLLVQIHMLTLPEEYRWLAKAEHVLADYLYSAHARALVEDEREDIRINRRFTVTRGAPPKLVGRRSA